MKFSIGNGPIILFASLSLLAGSCGGGSRGGGENGATGGNGSSALPLGWAPTFGQESSLDSWVAASTVFDDGSGGGPALYAGGLFTAAGGVELNRIAKWDGSTWSALGTGMNNMVSALAVFDDGSGNGPALYAGGLFTTAGGVEVNGIAKWDGKDWLELGAEMNGSVFALAVYDDGSESSSELYVGGSFTSAGGVEVNRIAKWDGSTWSALGAGMSGEAPVSVSALTVFDDGLGGGPALYAGGSFTAAGGKAVNRIAKWNGSTWSALGAGMSGEAPQSVPALTVFDDGLGGGPALHAGGSFTAAGGVEANRIARWDGSAWSALGAGMSGEGLTTVVALAAFDDGSGGGPALYAAGHFGFAGGVEVNGIARWDGSTWSALGAGLSPGPFGTALALSVYDDGSSSGGIPHGPSLFVGGMFDASPAGDPFLAKWGRSQDAVLFGPEESQQLTSLHPGASELEDKPCALTARIGTDLRLDDPELHLLLEHAHVAPLRNVQWLAGTIELRGGHWRQTEPLVLGIAGPARLVLAEGARLEVPRVIVGPQGELCGAGLLLGDLENQGLVASSAAGLELLGRYLEWPPGALNGELGSPPHGGPSAPRPPFAEAPALPLEAKAPCREAGLGSIP